jgi:hypothetical protein
LLALTVGDDSTLWHEVDWQNISDTEGGYLIINKEKDKNIPLVPA